MSYCDIQPPCQGLAIVILIIESIGRHVQLPSVLGCSEVAESVHNTRLWMSSGGTSSSLHFDTHENLMLAIDGTKTVHFWPADQAHHLYMDYHDRFGLSPVHPDRVDLEKCAGIAPGSWPTPCLGEARLSRRGRMVTARTFPAGTPLFAFLIWQVPTLRIGTRRAHGHAAQGRRSLHPGRLVASGAHPRPGEAV